MKNIEAIALLKDGLARANSLYSQHVEGIISLEPEPLNNLINILNTLNEEIASIEALTNQG